MTVREVKRFARVAKVVERGGCSALYRGELGCRLLAGHLEAGQPWHEANANLRWRGPAPSCSCDEWTPATNADGLVLACGACGEVVLPWPPPE